MKDHNYFVYIVTNPRKTTYYTGDTNDIERRLHEHYLNCGNNKTFAGKHYCYNLIYFEHWPDINFAIQRENEIKNLSRTEKEALIKTINPGMKFLTQEVWEF